MFPYQPPAKPDADAAARAYHAEDGKQHGGCLTAWMGVSVAFSLIGVVMAFQLLDLLRPGSLRPGANTGLLVFYIVGLVVLLVLNLASLYGIWKWARWGVYGIASVSIISLVWELMLGTANTADFIQPFIQLGVLWFLIRDKWAYFE